MIRDAIITMLPIHIISLFEQQISSNEPTISERMKREIAEDDLITSLTGLFEKDSWLKMEATKPNGIYLSGIVGGYVYYLLILYDKGSVILLSSYHKL